MTHENQPLNPNKQQSDFHDEFVTKDEFSKEKTNLKNLNINKVLKIVLAGGAVFALIIVGTYAKLQKNKETRAENGIESAISKPVEQNENSKKDTDNFGFNRTAPSTTPPEKTPEQLEMERQLAEQKQQLEQMKEQAKQEALAKEQALLSARQKSAILVSNNAGNGNQAVSPNADTESAGIAPELQPYLASMQDNKASSNGMSERVTSTTAKSMGGRFDASSSNDKAPIAHASYNSDRRMLIQQGKVIDAVLETAIKSDLPSNIIARITHDIYSEQGRNRLLPKGTRLFGQYSSMINDGQTEVGAVWNRAITPNGVEIMLDSPSTNGLGMAGLGGHVNNHYGRIFGTATLLSIIGAGVSNVGVSGNDQNNASQTYRTQVTNGLGSQASSILGRNLSIPPTITVDAGARIKVLIAKDLDFEAILNQ